MLVLGIESTAHTLGVGVIDENFRTLSSAQDMYKPELGKGFVPSELAEHHYSVCAQILSACLKQANLKMGDIDVIAFSQGMGIPNSLKVGATLARYLAARYNKTLVGVNHGVAHIEIGRIKTMVNDPVIVYLSGGNTAIVSYVDGRYRIFGESLDIPVGNALDVLAREMGLPMPGGPEIEKLAEAGKLIDLPYTVKGMDASFTGVMTAAIEKFREGKSKEDVAFSMQEICFSMLTEVTERALAHTNKKEVLLVGGVAANKRLQEMMDKMCEMRNAQLCVVPSQFSGDNGVMIACVGVLASKMGKRINLEDSGIKQKWRIEEVDIDWV